MNKNIDLNRLHLAAKCVRKGRTLSVGDVLLYGGDNETLCVAGWSHSLYMENITQQSALNELTETNEIFKQMLELCPNIIALAGKRQVRICLNFDYGTGAFQIGSILDGIVTWDIDFKRR